MPASLKSGSSYNMTEPVKVLFVLGRASESDLSNFKTFGLVSDPVNLMVNRSGCSTSTLAERLSCSPLLKVKDCLRMFTLPPKEAFPSFTLKTKKLVQIHKRKYIGVLDCSSSTK